MSGIPKYILTERIAQGGMAEIHLGKIVGSDNFSRVCAFKRILPQFAQDKDFVAMFRLEANVAKQLQNKNIVQVYDFVTDQQNFMLVMEYVDGQDLRSVLGTAEMVRRRIPLEIAVFITMEVLSGLAYAHSALDVTGRSMNIIHRDVSPQNILISYEGDVKITDFGIAKVQNSSSGTQVGVLKGKFRYMSPEQAMGKNVDTRTDIFAVGVVLYEMITMTRLFKGDDMAVLEQVRRCKIVPPSQVKNSKVPEELERIMMKLLARDPSHRYQSAKAAVKDLSRFLYSFRPDFFAGEVAEFMQTIFRDRLASSRERLRSTLALPVGAIGRTTRGVDVVAPESFHQSVLNVSHANFRPSRGNVARAEAGAPGQNRKQNVQPQRHMRNSISRGKDLVMHGQRPLEVSGLADYSPEQRTQHQGVSRRRSSGARVRRVPARRKSKLPALIWTVGGIVALAGVLFGLRHNLIPYESDLQLQIAPRAPVELTISSENGQEKKIVTGPYEQALLPGQYVFTISRPGFVSQTFSVQTSFLSRLIRRSLVLERQRELVQFRIITEPEGAQLSTQDGFFQEKTPALLSYLIPGQTYRFILRHPRCQPFTLTEKIPQSANRAVPTRRVRLAGCQ